MFILGYLTYLRRKKWGTIGEIVNFYSLRNAWISGDLKNWRGGYTFGDLSSNSGGAKIFPGFLFKPSVEGYQIRGGSAHTGAKKGA